MKIGPRRLWLLVPLFIGLFLLGAAFAMLQKSNEELKPVVEVAAPDVRAEQDRRLLLSWMDALSKDTNKPLTVKWQDAVLSGHFHGSFFDLEGMVAGSQVKLNRSDQATIVTINGERQDATTLLPYAMFTPYEHIALLKGHMQAIEPMPVQDQEKSGLTGYRLEIPSGEVKEIVAQWMGPAFPAKETMEEMDKSISVIYHIWYDTNARQLKQITMTLSIVSAAGNKQDQLTFLL